MRPLEILLAASCMPALAFAVFGGSHPRWTRVGLFLLPLVVLLLHLWMEKTRIHVFPIVVVASVLGLAGLSATLRSPHHHHLPLWMSVGAGLLGVALVVSGVALAWLFPVFKFPSPHGPHRVGTATLHLVDPVRTEIHSASDAGHRELMVQIWYPAWDLTWGDRAQYLPVEDAIPSPLLAQLSLVRTRAYPGAKIAKDQGGWPVVVYSPAWAGGRHQNTALCEALAAAGYVVVAIDHPFGAPAVKFPDGRIVTNARLAPMDFSSEASFARFLHEAATELGVRVGDVRLVLDALVALQAGELAGGDFKGALKLTAIGGLGYSFGGAVIAEACRVDSRLRAGVDLDGTLFGEAAEKGVDQPFLFMTDRRPPPDAAAMFTGDPARQRQSQFVAASLRDLERWTATRGGTVLRLPGVGHGNFCDEALYSRLGRFTGAGPANVRRTMETIHHFTISFFEETLRGVSPDGDAAAPPPGVIVERHPRP